MTSLATIIPLLTFAFVTSSTPGPNNVMLMSSGMNYGFKQSIPHMAGVMVGIPFMVLLVGLGLVQLFEQVPHSFTLLRVVSFCYLMYLAWRIALTKSLRPREISTQPLGFFEAALFQWVNPKAWVMALTAIAVYTPDSRPLNSVFIVVFVFVISGTFATFLWTLLGQQLRQFFSDPVKLRIVNITLALILVATLLPMLLQSQSTITLNP